LRLHEVMYSHGPYSLNLTDSRGYGTYVDSDQVIASVAGVVERGQQAGHDAGTADEVRPAKVQVQLASQSTFQTDTAQKSGIW
jgi:hypothetical protein